jgi:hypothetical protein
MKKKEAMERKKKERRKERVALAKSRAPEKKRKGEEKPPERARIFVEREREEQGWYIDYVGSHDEGPFDSEEEAKAYAEEYARRGPEEAAEAYRVYLSFECCSEYVCSTCKRGIGEEDPPLSPVVSVKKEGLSRERAAVVAQEAEESAREAAEGEDEQKNAVSLYGYKSGVVPTFRGAAPEPHPICELEYVGPIGARYRKDERGVAFPAGSYSVRQFKNGPDDVHHGPFLSVTEARNYGEKLWGIGVWYDREWTERGLRAVHV